MPEFTWELSSARPDQLKPVPEISAELKADRKKLAERLRGIPSYQTVYSRLVEERFSKYLEEHASEGDLIRLGRDVYNCTEDSPHIEPDGRLDVAKRDIITQDGRRMVITRDQREQARAAYEPYLSVVEAATAEVLQHESLVAKTNYYVMICKECHQQVPGCDRTIYRNSPDSETDITSPTVAVAERDRRSISNEEIHYLESHPERSQIFPSEWQQFLIQGEEEGTASH